MMMQAFRKIEQFLHSRRSYISFVLAVFAGILLVFASVSPWLKDPLGDISSAWKIPVYVGWPLRVAALNYGLLCIVGSLLAFLTGMVSAPFLSTKLSVATRLFVNRRLKWFYRLVGIYCLIIFLLFCLQYLLLDTQSIDQLAQSEMQSLLIARHLGYHLLPQLIPVNPFTIDSNSFTVRLALLANQGSLSILLPAFAAIVLLYASHQSVVIEPAVPIKSRPIRRWLSVAAFILIAICLLGRVPAATFCDSVAGVALQSGDYYKASRWLDRAVVFDPSLETVASYHIQRGQIDYFVYHDTQGQDSQAYIAFIAYQHGNYQIAYQDLFQIWKLHPTTQWITASFDKVMMRYIESRRPLQLGITSTDFRTSIKENDSSLTYVQELLQVDPSSVYAHYVLGRIECDIQSYVQCAHEMQKVIALSPNKDIQSTAYTYIGLSEAGQGDYIASRTFLLKAVQLDPSYRNNTAREELSGLH